MLFFTEEVYFKIKRNTALKKLMDAYCARENLVPSSVRFVYGFCYIYNNA
jgi:hypothetical protein